MVRPKLTSSTYQVDLTQYRGTDLGGKTESGRTLSNDRMHLLDDDGEEAGPEDDANYPAQLYLRPERILLSTR